MSRRSLVVAVPPLGVKCELGLRSSSWGRMRAGPEVLSSRSNVSSGQDPRFSLRACM